MKDNALGAFMVFFMAIVALLLIDDFTQPELKTKEIESVKLESNKTNSQDQLATTDLSE